MPHCATPALPSQARHAANEDDRVDERADRLIKEELGGCVGVVEVVFVLNDFGPAALSVWMADCGCGSADHSSLPLSHLFNSSLASVLSSRP